jgi:hypothetical protein
LALCRLLSLGTGSVLHRALGITIRRLVFQLQPPNTVPIETRQAQRQPRRPGSRPQAVKGGYVTDGVENELVR